MSRQPSPDTSFLSAQGKVKQAIPDTTIDDLFEMENYENSFQEDSHLQSIS